MNEANHTSTVLYQPRYQERNLPKLAVQMPLHRICSMPVADELNGDFHAPVHSNAHSIALRGLQYFPHKLFRFPCWRLHRHSNGAMSLSTFLLCAIYLQDS